MDHPGPYRRIGMVARWRPVHLGHVPVLRGLCREADLALIGIGSANRYNARNQNKPEEQEIVWHSLRLENSLKLPWTTAPAQVIKDNQLLGQDILNYTPPGAETDLRITRAVSVKAEQIEYETDRKRDAARFYGYHYDLVTVRGELEVNNYKTKPISLEITKYLSGELKSSEPKALESKLARGLRRANPRSKLTWTLELKSGEQQKLHYTYEVYIRR